MYFFLCLRSAGVLPPPAFVAGRLELLSDRQIKMLAPPLRSPPIQKFTRFFRSRRTRGKSKSSRRVAPLRGLETGRARPEFQPREARLNLRNP